MPLRYHHGCHRPAHSSGSLLSGTEGQIRGATQFSYLIRWQALTLIQVFQQIRLYAWCTAMVCNEASAWPAAAYALPFKRDVSWRGLDGKEGTFREDISPMER